LSLYSAEFGSRETQSQVVFDLKERGCKASISGIYVPSQSQRCEINTKQIHEAPDTISNLVYKGAVLDESNSTWRGMIQITSEAPRSQSHQTNNNLILSNKAHVDSIPGMEILTNDVQCKHGATVGKIDPEQLFYMESRGIDPTEGKQLLIEGFLDPIIQKYPLEKLRKKIKRIIHEKIESRSGYA